MNDSQSAERKAAEQRARQKAMKEAEKQTRLKAALRDNLRRRKVPQRRDDADGTADTADTAL